MDITYHEPALLEETINGLAVKPDGVYVDATFGGGGHSRELLKHLKGGRLFAFDQDEDAAVNEIADDRFMLIRQNFRYIKNFLKYYHALPVNGIIADLGISSHQIDKPSRGFSTRFDSDLDMRMNQASAISAKEIINTYSEEKLRNVFRNYGEINNAPKLAQLIVASRGKKEIKTVKELKEIISHCVPREIENKYHAQVFQALRIEVNDETGALKELLIRSAEVLAGGGRLAVISYHSLEDRLVKNFISKGRFEGEPEKDLYGNIQNIQFRAVNKKPLTPGDVELRRNPRVRSAKLRIAEKI